MTNPYIINVQRDYAMALAFKKKVTDKIFAKNPQITVNQRKSLVAGFYTKSHQNKLAA